VLARLVNRVAGPRLDRHLERTAGRGDRRARWTATTWAGPSSCLAIGRRFLIFRSDDVEVEAVTRALAVSPSSPAARWKSRETLQFANSNEASLQYPTSALTTWKWLGRDLGIPGARERADRGACRLRASRCCSSRTDTTFERGACPACRSSSPARSRTQVLVRRRRNTVMTIGRWNLRPRICGLLVLIFVNWGRDEGPLR
jgi:hypothetical protein